MKKFKGFFTGMVTMLLIVSLAGTSIAKNEKVTKELEYRNIKVSLDGKILDLKDSAGNPVEPFMFDGTNYLPVRALAETLGLNVAWDSKNATVVLTSPKNTAAPEENSEQPDATDKTEETRELLFSKNQVRIYYTGYTKTETGHEIGLSIENYTGYPISGYLFDTFILGEKVNMSLSCKTEPGQTAEGKITISDENLEKAGIKKDFKTVKVRFQMFDTEKQGSPDEPKVVSFLTDPIIIRFK